MMSEWTRFIHDNADSFRLIERNEEVKRTRLSDMAVFYGARARADQLAPGENYNSESWSIFFYRDINSQWWCARNTQNRFFFRNSEFIYG